MRIIHRSVILPFRNHLSCITGASMSESQQQQRTTDALQFTINHVMKVNLSKCYAIISLSMSLKNPQIQCQNCIQDVQPGHQYLTASRCSHSIQSHRLCSNGLTLYQYFSDQLHLPTMRRPCIQRKGSSKLYWVIVQS